MGLLVERRLGCLPVVDVSGRLVGILTVADLVGELVRICASAEGLGELDEVVAACMTEAPVTVDPRASVAEAIEICRAHGMRHLPVQSDGSFIGLVSDRDLRRSVGYRELERKVEEIMTSDLVTVGPESLLSDAAELMQRLRVDSIPVTREGRVVGILTTSDVLELMYAKLAHT